MGLMNLTIPTALLLASALALHAAATPEPAGKPNILVILTDDIGWGDYQCYNAQGKIASPNVDRLAREGMRFTHAHTPAALCSPTRYSMLTGNYPWRGRDPAGTWGFNELSQILPGQKTVANLLQAAGYRTAMFGKAGFGGTHAMKGAAPDFTRPMTDGPVRWGFDYSFIIPRGHQAAPHFFLENEIPSCGADKVVRGDGDANFSAPDWDASKVGESLLDHADKFLDDVLARSKAGGARAPFFLHFCTDGAHSPYAPAAEIRGVSLKDQTKLGKHTDMVLETDILVGKLIESLEKRGLLDNTLICFTSDNGGIPAEQHLGHDAVGGLRGLKAHIGEGGTRVPFIVRWPGKVAAGSVRQQVVCAHDIVATALDLAGVNIPADQCLDAVSLAPVLLGERDDSQPIRGALLVQSSPGRDAFDDGGIHGGAVNVETAAKRKTSDLFAPEGGEKDKRAKRQLKKQKPPSDGMAHALYEGDWKLVTDIADQPSALYDLHADIAEQTNLLAAPAQAGRAQRLIKKYRDLRASQRSTPAASQLRAGP